MDKNKKHKLKNLTRKLLETRLRQLPAADAPPALKERLFAAIPDDKMENTRHYRIKWRPVAWDFSASAAAAVVILVLILTLNYGLSVSSQTVLVELNEPPLYYAACDQNNFMYDQNNIWVESSLLYDLKMIDDRPK